MMEVRCCCDAGQLIGWLPTPRKIDYGKTVNFKAGDEFVPLEVSSITLSWNSNLFAYKSRDYPMDLLRKIPQFVEATEYEIALGQDQPVDFNSRRAVRDVRAADGGFECPAVSGPPRDLYGQHDMVPRGVRK